MSSDKERLSALEEKSRFYDSFFTDLKNSIDKLHQSINGLGEELRQERKQEKAFFFKKVDQLQEDVDGFKNKMEKDLKVFLLFTRNKWLAGILFLILYFFTIKEIRDQVLDSIFRFF